MEVMSRTWLQATTESKRGTDWVDGHWAEATGGMTVRCDPREAVIVRHRAENRRRQRKDEGT